MSTTKEKLTEALKTAMRAGDVMQKTTIRSALSAIKYAEVDKKEPLEESDVLGILAKEVKIRHETISDAKKAGNEEMVTASEAEIAFLVQFLPQALTEEELKKIVQATITESGATTMREMGQVMKLVMPQVKGRADGNQVSSLVRSLLG